LNRGALKNIFEGYADDGGGGSSFLGPDASLLGTQNAMNGYMEVVHHEGMHDMPAYVTHNADLYRRWGQMLVYAGGHDAVGANYIQADGTGWYSESLTKTYWQTKGWWNGTDPCWTC